MSEISERLRERARSGPAHDELDEEAADLIEWLEHNQISHSYTSLAQTAALQAQEADARARYAKKLERKCEQLTEALTKAIGLQDALLTEMGIMQQKLGQPPSLQLLAAKHNFDAAMQVLLGKNESAREEKSEVESDNHGETG